MVTTAKTCIDVAREGEGRDGSLAVGGEHVIETDQRLPAIEVETDQHAGDRISQIVVAAGAVVEAVLPAARRAPLEAAELRRQARQVEQFDATGVQERQQVVIQIALRPGALLEFNPMLGKSGSWPFAGVFVAGDLGHAITAQQCGALLHR